MTGKVRWGVLGAARIATNKVIPAMQRGERTTVLALASRNLEKARAAARKLDVPRAYGSYEELLADPEVEAVYNPLPNHLHLKWSVRAAEAGKHVLCEKPLALNVEECRAMIAVRERTGVVMGDGFMVRCHPQWLRAREIVRSGEIGELRALTTVFSYNNPDPANIRNVAAYGGGGLMDIGCYCIQFARFLWEREPARVSGALDVDPANGVDRLASAILDFGGAHAIFTCGTRMIPFQRTEILGTKGRVEVEIPVNAPTDRPMRILVDATGDLSGSGVRVEEFPVCNQYTLHGDAFSRAVREGGPVPSPLEDGLANMIVIEAVQRAAASGAWERLES